MSPDAKVICGNEYHPSDPHTVTPRCVAPSEYVEEDHRNEVPKLQSSSGRVYMLKFITPVGEFVMPPRENTPMDAAHAAREAYNTYIAFVSGTAFNAVDIKGRVLFITPDIAAQSIITIVRSSVEEYDIFFRNVESDEVSQAVDLEQKRRVRVMDDEAEQMRKKQQALGSLALNRPMEDA